MARKAREKKGAKVDKTGEREAVEDIIKRMEFPLFARTSDGGFLCAHEIHIHKPGYTVVYRKQSYLSR